MRYKQGSSSNGVVRIAALVIGLMTAGQVMAADTDHDGLDDAWEQALAELYRPEMRFHSGESFWPTSARWYVKHARMHLANDEGGDLIWSSQELDADPMRILRADEQGFDISDFQRKTSSADTFVLPLQESLSPEAGEGAIPGTHAPNLGLLPTIPIYAQVHRLKEDIITDQGPLDTTGLYVIYFFYGFAYSDGTWGTGHDGDWERLMVFVHPDVDPFEISDSQRLESLAGVMWYAHSCQKLRLPGMTGFPGTDGIPWVYVEDCNHGFYPEPDMYCWPINRSANGEGPNYRVQNVVNMGEPASPIVRPGETVAQHEDRLLAMMFNGLYGEVAANGIRMRSLPRPWALVHVDTTADPVIDAPATGVDEALRYFGTRAHPYNAVGLAFSAGPSGVAAGGTVRFLPGQHDVGAHHIINVPARLEAVEGPAVLTAP